MQYYVYSDKSEEYNYFFQWIADKTIIGVDTETEGLDIFVSKMLLLQIGNTQDQFVFDAYKLGKEKITLILNTINHPDIIKVFHNAKFDYSVIKLNYQIELENIRCTMIADQLLTAGKKLSHSLKSLLDKYLNVKISKEEREGFTEIAFGDDFTENQITYAAVDVMYLIPLYNKLMELINERDMTLLSEIEFHTIKVTADMEINGIKIDKNKWLQLKNDAYKKQIDAFNKLNEFFLPYCHIDLFGNPDINYNSPTQLLPLLCKITGQELESTNENYIKYIDHPVITALIEYRKATKLLTTYGQKFIDENVQADGRIHTQFNQLGANTGRFSSKNPNLQNIPHQQIYRDPFIAEDGYKLICADYSGQEMALLAYISQEKNLIDAINNDIDIHCMTASLIYNIPLEEFFIEPGNYSKDNLRPDKKIIRNNAKSTNFGVVFGMGPKRLSETLRINIDEAKEILNKYYEKLPGVDRLMKYLTAEFKKNKYAYSPLDGRRNDFSNIDWDNNKKVSHGINAAKNLPMQGAAASVTKLALVYIDKKIKEMKLDAKIVLVVHDEILVEVREDQAEQAAKMVAEEMIRAFNFFCPTVIMRVKPEISDHWVH